MIGRFIVKIANLLEAEGREAKNQFTRLWIVILMLTSAAMLGVGAMVMLAIALFWTMQVAVGRSGAMALSAMFLLIVMATLSMVAALVYKEGKGGP